mmetsp:Transcript_12895/g.32909  ORF Transcript_12895/g.32909 Transcript_12895/m.32909 type:complete len:213 (+) Transcript_12895:176-814(+)
MMSPFNFNSLSDNPNWALKSSSDSCGARRKMGSVLSGLPDTLSCSMTDTACTKCASSLVAWNSASRSSLWIFSVTFKRKSMSVASFLAMLMYWLCVWPTSSLKPARSSTAAVKHSDGSLPFRATTGVPTTRQSRTVVEGLSSQGSPSTNFAAATSFKKVIPSSSSATPTSLLPNLSKRTYGAILEAGPFGVSDEKNTKKKLRSFGMRGSACW